MATHLARILSHNLNIVPAPLYANLYFVYTSAKLFMDWMVGMIVVKIVKKPLVPCEK